MRGDRNKHRGAITLSIFRFLAEAKNERKVSVKGMYKRIKFGKAIGNAEV